MSQWSTPFGRLSGREGTGRTARPSGEGSVRHQPFLAEATDRSDPLIVAVVVDKGHVCLFSCAREEEIRRRNSAVIAARSQRQLSLPRSSPELSRHRNRFEGGEAVGDLMSARLIGRKAGELENDQIADQNLPGLDGGIEPSCELRKPAIAHPGPGTGVEESGSIEAKQSQTGHGA